MYISIYIAKIYNNFTHIYIYIYIYKTVVDWFFNREAMDLDYTGGCVRSLSVPMHLGLESALCAP